MSLNKSETIRGAKLLALMELLGDCDTDLIKACQCFQRANEEFVIHVPDFCKAMERILKYCETNDAVSAEETFESQGLDRDFH